MHVVNESQFVVLYIYRPLIAVLTATARYVPSLFQSEMESGRVDLPTPVAGRVRSESFDRC